MSPKNETAKELLRLENQIAIITGAASGIGKAIALRFAEEGAKVAIFDLNRKGAEKVAREIGSQAIAVKVDIRDDQQIASAVKKTIKRFGQINILVNNAGITDPVSLLDKRVKEKWKKVIETNFTGAFFMTETVAKTMVKNGWQGSIISITSVQGHIAPPHGSYYPAAKAGLAAATRSWARQLAEHGIRANALAPGAIMNTGMNKDITPENDKKRALELNIPLARHGLPEEIADAALFLATNDYVTGIELVVDGGFLLTH
jgi:NAD(P)-dependent dehydrogenase (short-subunit alcohol dehydrogenase family)